MRGGNTHWSGGVLRFAFDDPRELGPLLPGVENEYEDFYSGIQPYTREDFHDDLMRVTSGQTDPVLSRLLVDNSKDTVFWMNTVGQVPMEPSITLTGVKKGNRIVWARGLVVRAEHEGVGLSRSWFNTCEQMGIEVRYGAAVIDLLQDDNGAMGGVSVREEKGVTTLSAPAVILGCGGFEANVQMRTQHIGPLVGAAKVRGTPHNQGDGLRMAMALGAMPWGQWSGCHATPISADWGNFAPREMTDRSNRLSYLYGVMINRLGHRFVDEGAEVAITMSDGRVFSRKIDNLVGRGVTYPMTSQEMWEKFCDCAQAGGLPKADIAPLFERLETLEKVIDIRTVTRLLQKRSLPVLPGNVEPAAFYVDTTGKRGDSNTLEETSWVP